MTTKSRKAWPLSRWPACLRASLTIPAAPPWIPACAGMTAGAKVGNWAGIAKGLAGKRQTRFALCRHAGAGRNPGKRGPDFKRIPVFNRQKRINNWMPRRSVPDAALSPAAACARPGSIPASCSPRLKRRASPVPRSAVCLFQRMPARLVVIPAKAGIQGNEAGILSGFRFLAARIV